MTVSELLTVLEDAESLLLLTLLDLRDADKYGELSSNLNETLDRLEAWEKGD